MTVTLPSQSIFQSVLIRRPIAGPPGLAYLCWRMDLPDDADRVVQIYLDGRWYDTVEPNDAPGLWLHVAERRTVTVELLAVDRQRANDDLADQLAAWQPPFVSSAALAVVRDEALPADSRVVVTVDGQDRPAGPLWDAMTPRGGFGGLFGYGQFGYDRATSPGLGLAGFGAGPFGSDGDPWLWRCDDLPAGEHAVSGRLEDQAGRLVGQLDAPQNRSLDPPLPGAHDLRIENGTTLRWDAPTAT